MTNDLRDERLARLLDAAASRIDVTPHVEPVVHHGSLRRGVRTIAMVAAVAVFVGAVGYGALRARNASAPSVDPSTWNEYPSPDGWTARYPDGWVVQPFAGPVTKIYLSGAFFSNVAYDFHHPDLGPNDFTSGWDLSSFPRDGVTVEFERFVGGPPEIQPGPDTPFPLSLESTPAVQSSSTPESGGQRSIDIVHDGSRYTLNVWFGADASQEDRELARLLVTTIAFPGTTPVEPSPSKPRTRSNAKGETTVISAPVSFEWPYPARPVAGSGAIWMPARTGDAVVRLDTRSLTTETITVPATAVAVGDARVWAAGVAGDGTPTLSSVDPSTRRTASSFPLRAEPRAIAWGDGSVWVAFPDGTVDRIDGATGTVLATIDVHGEADELAAAAGSVWANLNGLMEVVRIDTVTDRLAGKPILGRAAITSDQDALWATENGAGELIRVDGRTGETSTWSIPGSESPPTGPAGVPAPDGSGGAWVALIRGGSFGPDTLWHVTVGEPNPAEVAMPNIAQDFVSADGALWFVQMGRVVRYVPSV
jgi:streptogramin lyase